MLLNQVGFRKVYNHVELIEGSVKEEVDLVIIDTGYFEADRELYAVNHCFKFFRIFRIL